MIQKRSKRKNGLYATTGGHPKAGESSIEGIVTETKEEIGLDIDPNELHLYFSGRTDEKRAFWDDYYIKMDVPDIKKLKLQEDEVSSVDWFSEDEVRKLMKDGKFFENHFEEFEILIEWLKNKKR